MNTKRITQLYGELKVEYGKRISGKFETRIQHQDLLDYVWHCLPNRSIFASRIYIWSAEDIQGFCDEPTLYPYAVFKNGFLPIGQSMSTDLLAVDVEDGRSIWFDRNHFIDGAGTLISHDQKEVDANRVNLEHVGIFINQFSELFVLNVIGGKYDSLFSLLD